MKVGTADQHLVFSDDRYTSVRLGQVVRSQVTADDVACGWGYYCQYFQLSIPRDGMLQIGLTHAPGRIYSGTTTPIDMWIANAAQGAWWMDFHVPDVEAFARTPVRAGEIYQAGVVSYEMPGVTFQLRFTLEP